MKWPELRTDTITRGNIAAAQAVMPELDTPEKVAAFFCGNRVIDGRPVSRAKPRHVARAYRLMTPSAAGPEQANRT